MRHASNLPRPRTRLIEREQALSEVCAWLRNPDVSMVTLTGPAGVGKTRLALEVGSRLARDGGTFPDGVVFVDLSGVKRSQDVVPTIAMAVGANAQGTRSSPAALSRYLAGRRTLLVVDNFEHVLAAADDLAQILRRSEAAKALLTSRTVTRVAEERVYPVRPLQVRAPDRAQDPASLAGLASVALFLDRARARLAGYAPAGDELRTIAELCRLLDGLPLAIELAASQVALMTPASMLRRLEAELRGDAAQGGPPELTGTLQRTLEWSTSLLSPAARALFPELAVFAAGWSLDAVEAVCARNDDERAAVPGLLGELLDASLIVEVGTPRGERGRRHWRLLETLWAFAARKLAPHDETRRSLEDAHAAYYLGWMAEMGPALVGPGREEALEEVEAAYENVRRAWRHAAAGPEPHWRRLAHATDALWRFMAIRGRHADGADLFGAAVRALARLNGRGPSVALARCLCAQGSALFRMGRLAEARSALDRSLGLLRHYGEQRQVAFALNHLAATVHLEGAYTQERAMLEQSVALAHATGDRWLCAYSLNDLSLVTHLLGAREQAEAIVEQAIAIHTGLDDRRGLAFDLQNLGVFAAARGDLDAAEALHARSLDLRSSLGDSWGVAASRLELGALARQRRRPAQAKGLLLRCMLDAEIAHALPLVLEALTELVAVRLDEGRAASARLLAAPLPRHSELHPRPWGGAARALEALRDPGNGGAPRPSPAGATSEAWAAELQRVAAELPPSWRLPAPGERLASLARLLDDVDTASDAALAYGEGPPAGRAHGSADTDAPLLTPREREILRWIARGAGNRDIAEELGISVRTVERHVSTIYEKLGARGTGARASATAYAFQHGLLS